MRMGVCGGVAWGQTARVKEKARGWRRSPAAGRRPPLLARALLAVLAVIEVLAVLAACLGCPNAEAQEAAGPGTVDMGRRGSIRLTMTCDGAAVPGGLLALYQVADVVPYDGGHRFELTEAFAASGVALDAVSVADPQTAQALASYAGERGLAGDVRAVSADGTLVYSDLAPGLYLLVQAQPAEGFLSVEPFLVSVPLLKDGAYRYDVDATPKVSVEAAPGPAEPPTPPAKPDDGRLPQTGQLAWPVPVLVAAGLVLFAVGWALRSGCGRGEVPADGGKR